MKYLDEMGQDSLKQVLSANDPVTIAVTDVAEDQPRMTELMTGLVSSLHDEVQVPFGQIIVLWATGNEEKYSEEEKKQILGDYVCGNCMVSVHEENDPLIEVGHMKNGTAIEAAPLVVGRKVIVVGSGMENILSEETVPAQKLKQKELEEIASAINVVCGVKTEQI